MFYSTKTFNDLDPNSPTYAQDITAFYREKLENIQYVLDQSCEMLETGLEPKTQNTGNAAIGLKMLNMLGENLQELW